VVPPLSIAGTWEITELAWGGTDEGTGRCGRS
jgi:hypothetical protein